MTGSPSWNGFKGRVSTGALAFLLLGSVGHADPEPPHSAALDAAIINQARRHGVPEKLVRRIVMRESKYNAKAHNRLYWGLMQISYPTAKSMGFKGKPRDLLDPFVNLTYAVPYLANAFIIAGKQEDAAVRLYASGYYQTAKARGLLDELRTAESKPVTPQPTLLTAATQPVANLATAIYNTPGAVAAAVQNQDAQAQTQTGAAEPPPAPPAASQPVPAAPAQTVAGTHGGGAGHDPDVMMTASKGGLVPPKKWTRDGGMSVIAKGDQRIDKFAAVRLDGAAAPGPKDETVKTSHGKPKLTVYAMLDPPQRSQPNALASQRLSGFQAYAPAGQEAGSSQTALAAAALPAGNESAFQLRGPVDSGAEDAKPAAGPKASEPKANEAKTSEPKTSDTKLTGTKPSEIKTAGGKTIVAKAVPAKPDTSAKPQDVALATPSALPPSASATSVPTAELAAATIPAIVVPPLPVRTPVKLTALVLRSPETAPVTGNALVTRGLLMGAAAPLSASAFVSSTPAAVSVASAPPPVAKPLVKAALPHAAPARMPQRILARTALKPVQLHNVGG